MDTQHIETPSSDIPVRAIARPMGRIENLKHWQPGQSGNPSGKGGAYKEVLGLARRTSIRAMQRMVELVESDDERVATVACNTIMDRAWGKVREQTEGESGPSLDMSRLSPAELAMFRALVAKGIGGNANESQEQGETGQVTDNKG